MKPRYDDSLRLSTICRAQRAGHVAGDLQRQSNARQISVRTNTDVQARIVDDSTGLHPARAGKDRCERDYGQT